MDLFLCFGFWGEHGYWFFCLFVFIFIFCVCVSVKGLFLFGVLCLFSREQREKEINLGGEGVREDLEEMTEWKYMIKIYEKINKN